MSSLTFRPPFARKFFCFVWSGILGWFSNRTGTSVDDGKARGKDYLWTRLPVSNLSLCRWSSQLFDLRAPSSTDVPVLLLNQSSKFITQHLRHRFVIGFVRNTHTTVMKISRITFTAALTFRVIVKEVLLKILPQFQGRQWWQKCNSLISYRGNFCPTPFYALEKKYPGVSHDQYGTICVAHLTIAMEPIPLPEKEVSWVTVSYPDYCSRSTWIIPIANVFVFSSIFVFIFRCSHFIQYSWQPW